MINLLLGALTALYPLAVFFGSETIGLGTLAALMAALLLIRLLLMPVSQLIKLGGLLLAIVIASLWFSGQDDRWLTLHPVVLNACLLVVFSASLIRGTPMIERIARIRNMDVGPHNIRYLRNLTAIWATFFAVASLLSIATVIHGDRGLWTLWNGVLVYVGIGILTIAELLYRRRFKARLAQQAAADTGVDD